MTVIIQLTPEQLAQVRPELDKAAANPMTGFVIGKIWESGMVRVRFVTARDLMESLSKTIAALDTGDKMNILEKFTKDDLLAELKRREDTEVPQPEPLENPNYSSLLATCESYMAELGRHESEDSELPHYIYEAAMTAIYGLGVWKWIVATQQS